jgi:hypothetical protein
MPQAIKHKNVVPPPEIEQARTRLKRALWSIFNDPAFKPERININALQSGVDDVMNDPANWDRIIAFQNEIEGVVRQFVMSPQPTESEIYEALDILEKFIIRGMVELGGQMQFVAGMAAGAVITTVKLDDSKLMAVPRAYMTLRSELLGMPMSTVPRPAHQ